jgi:protein translocase SecG subunit
MTALTGALPYIQIILAVLIVAAVLMQRSESGVGGAFGGGDGWSSAFHTRRGFEKFLFSITIVFGILFALVSLLALIIK